MAFRMGYQTSVSIEPMLDSSHIEVLVGLLEPYVTDTIWIGKMNQISRRVPVENETDRLMVRAIIQGQSDRRISEIYQVLKDNPKVRWKESFKKILGFPLAQAPGQDI